MFKYLGAILARLTCAFVLVLGLDGAANAASYLNPKLGDLKAEDRAVVAKPQPVQIIFQFQTNGAANSSAAKFLKPFVLDTVKASGAFTEISDQPVANGAILSITINNVADMNAAKSSGFVTGLTFGLKGSTIVDNYVCTAEFLPGGSAPMVTKTLDHSVTTTLGATAAPEGGIKMKNLNVAAETMTRQLVSHTVNNLAKDPVLAGAPAAAPAPAAPADAAPAPAPVETAPAPTQAAA